MPYKQKLPEPSKALEVYNSNCFTSASTPKIGVYAYCTCFLGQKFSFNDEIILL